MYVFIAAVFLTAWRKNLNRQMKQHSHLRLCRLLVVERRNGTQGGEPRFAKKGSGKHFRSYYDSFAAIPSQSIWQFSQHVIPWCGPQW